MLRHIFVLVLIFLLPACAQDKQEKERSTYVLGSGDQVLVRVLDMDEIGRDPYQIDIRGNISLPMAGRIQAKGLTIEQLEDKIAERLKTVIKNPQVTVNVQEVRSQPVSVLGAVKQPGVYQLRGQMTLLESLSMAQGLREDAGYAVRIARQKDWGKIPLENATEDETGQYWVAEVSVKEIMEARSPEKNISLKPHDVVTVPKGELVYVMGAVKKSGGFVLGEREKVTALQALSMAEGFAQFSKETDAKILRKSNDPEKRLEIPVNLTKVLKGEIKDVPMESNDILYVPISGAKRVMAKTVDTAIAMGTAAIWRR